MSSVRKKLGGPSVASRSLRVIGWARPLLRALRSAAIDETTSIYWMGNVEEGMEQEIRGG